MEERSQIQLLCVAVDVGFSSLSADRWAAFPGGFQNRGRLGIQGGAGQHREDPARVSKASLGGLGCVTQGTGHPLVSGPPSGALRERHVMTPASLLMARLELGLGLSTFIPIISCSGRPSHLRMNYSPLRRDLAVCRDSVRLCSPGLWRGWRTPQGKEAVSFPPFSREDVGQGLAR